jgi:hypothetical protein
VNTHLIELEISIPMSVEVPLKSVVIDQVHLRRRFHRRQASKETSFWLPRKVKFPRYWQWMLCYVFSVAIIMFTR